MKSRFFVRLSYNGAMFSGWQRQPNAMSVQQCLEEHFSTLLRQNVEFTGAGRTDAGVHAKNYYAHVQMDISNFEISDLIYKLNSFLPHAIVIHDIVPVQENAHARFDALQRTYQYWISQEKDPFYRELSYFFHGHLQLDEMNKAAEMLIGTNDFEGFSKKNTDLSHYFCEVKEAFWKKDDHFLVFTITANRFLRNMVRAIVGTLLETGRELYSPQRIKEIIESGNRQKAGNSLPAHGLYLMNITYPGEIFL